MKKIIAALSLCLALVLAPYTVQLTVEAAHQGIPWHTFRETIPDVTGARQGSCAGEPILVAMLAGDGKDYIYFAAENGRFVFAEMAGEKPAKIYVGQQLPAPDQDVIKVLDSHPYSEERDGSGPCGHLFPKTA